VILYLYTWITAARSTSSARGGPSRAAEWGARPKSERTLIRTRDGGRSRRCPIRAVSAVALRTGIGTFSRRDCDS
jgi:hypothetical protein